MPPTYIKKQYVEKDQVMAMFDSSGINPKWTVYDPENQRYTKVDWVIKMTIPSITKNETLGLEAVTIFNEKPYFFLFSDIDSKDKDELLKVLKFYQ